VIEAQFGASAYPTRVRMAELPQGSTLIPNPVNRVPGFQWGNHYCLPGFPVMAWPMLDWVLDRDWPEFQEVEWEQMLWVDGVGENTLVELLQHLESAWPGLHVASLPHIGPQPTIELSVRGRPRERVDAAFDDLQYRLDQQKVRFRLS
jgi:molybdopterin-biosynthesis enzyme MoeA-like protein